MISSLKHGLSMVIANSRLILSGELIITDQHMNPLDAQDITDLGIDEKSGGRSGTWKRK